ncbi:MAG: response regulator [Acidobacteriota bacterium]
MPSHAVSATRLALLFSVLALSASPVEARGLLGSAEGEAWSYFFASFGAAVGTYHLIQYTWRRRRDDLWLGLLSFSVAPAVGLSFADESILLRLRLLAHCVTIPVLVQFLWPFLGHEISPRLRRFQLSFGIFPIPALILPTAWLPGVGALLWAWSLPFGALLVYRMTLDSLARRRASLFMAPAVGYGLVVAVAESILQVAGWGTTDPASGVGVVLLWLAAMLVMADRNDKANDELELLRQQLEQMVEDRTTELTSANERLQAEITERQLAEEAMHMLERAVEQSIDGIAVADLDGGMQFINEAWAQMHGYEVFELLGYDLTIFHTPEQMREQVEPLMDRVRDHGAHEAEIQHRRRGGGTFPTWQTSTFLQDGDGRPLGYVFIVRDLTERQKQEDESRRLQDRVQQAEKLESLASLAGGIAHDYNNILTGVLGNVALAYQETRDEDQRQRLRQIEISAERAAELTDQLLAYSGEEQAAAREVAVNDLIEERRGELDRLLVAGTRLELHLKRDLPPIHGDPDQIAQAISNLLANASDSLGDTANGLVMVRTALVNAKRSTFVGAVLDSGAGEGLHVLVEVSDTGQGMDDATRERMFEPFFSTKTSGRGMGLAAVLGIVRAHHGAIKVFSRAGRGTTVEMYFPAVEAAPRRTTERESFPTWEAFGTALVVDDEQLVREVAAKVLQRQGFQVLTAADGREALDIFESRKDDIRLVLLDLTMPEMDGETVAREMRRFDSEAKVLLMSGYREKSATQGLDGDQIAGFLHKPFRPNELVAKVQEILG